MYKTIMVPLDGSAFSEQALPVAVATARASGARLHLLHVKSPDVLGWRAADGSAAYLTGVSERVASELNESVSFALIDHRDDHYVTRTETAARIADYARDQSVDLIVMASRGHGGLKRAFTGSVADALVRGSPAPLLLVRPQRDGVRRIKTILAAVDHTIGSETILDAAGELATAFDAEVLLLHVLAPLQTFAPEGAPLLVVAAHEDLALANAESQRRLEQLADRLRAGGIPVRYHTLVSSNIPHVIGEVARTLKPDVIAMATRAPRPIVRAVVGSVTDEVVRHATIPVLVARQE